MKAYSQTAIAKQLGVTQATICNDLKAIRAEWLASTIRNFDLNVSIGLERLDLVRREAWEAWERSKKPAQSAVLAGEGASQPTRKTLRNQNGDPRYLTVVLRCDDARRELLALDASKGAGSEDAEGPLTISNVLMHIKSAPPPPPNDTLPSNVIDVDAICRELEATAREPSDGEKQGG